MSKNNKEIEAYTKVLMKCVSDEEYFDETLIEYLIKYNKEIIEGYNFIKREPYGVIKSNLWGYIKGVHYKNEDKLKKWAIILNKDENEQVMYEYLKFNYNDRDKRDRKSEYKPFYFNEEIKEKKYIKVSEDFLNIVDSDRYRIKIETEKLSETEIKLIMNDLINDDNINQYGRLDKKEGIDKLIIKVKDYIINNYEQLEEKAKQSKKSFIRVIAMGDNIINEAFQSIQGVQREQFIDKYNLESKLLTYMRYKDINKEFLLHSLYHYKNKDFWIKDLNCYNKKENIFSIKEAIKDFIIIGRRLDEMYESKTHNIHNWDKAKFMVEVDSCWDNAQSNKIMKILNFFKEEIKGAKNYKEEMEKLMLLAVIEKSEKMYFIVKEYMRKENGDQEDMKFNHPILKEVSINNSSFLEKMKEIEIKRLNQKLEDKLSEKGMKTSKLKI